MTSLNEETIRNKLVKCGQEHLLAFYGDLDAHEKSALLEDIDGIDFDLMSRLYARAQHGSHDVQQEGTCDISPLRGVDSTAMPAPQKEKMRALGLKELSEGRMAALTMAGGQGTRLGHTGPKGTYDIGLPSHKSLFEIQSDGLKRISAEAGRPVLWYIMTSHINHSETESFFREHGYFGYGKENIIFFRQEKIPALDRSGRLLLEDKHTVLKSPNGNGGMFSSLKKAGGFDHMKKCGIKYLFVCGIDNCLVKMADPLFLGFKVSGGYRAVAKSFLKRTADEKAGVLCMKNGHPCVIEYTEIPEDLAALKNEDGEWTYGDTNVLNYIFDTDLAEELAGEGLDYHVAVKKLKYLDTDTGKNAEIPDGYKFELFLFDAFSKIDRLGILRIERTEEFSPVKNKTGIDSAESARVMYMNMYGDGSRDCMEEIK